VTNHRPTLLDPFEVLDPREIGYGSRPRIPLASLEDEVTNWLDRAAFQKEMALLIEACKRVPPAPEPIDRRWRARGWGHESLLG
jgi:hypothetical protein